ncbi:MAG TPA: thioredoxin domain-containing protein, partial [Actinomycetota bacterium]|nr:thioredoxin domain-containing protein [Actinomycetota bacterium]
MTNSGASGADTSPELDQVETGTATETSAGQGPAQHSPKANRLIGETSPYLLQHAYNPVDWYPWGPEALELALAQDKPIVLSIGYAACHWCHVMERESFEDQQTAGLMNEKFVSIKVDREERPDIDAIYMDAVQAMTRHGGWPMTMFLAPDGTPFYGGTYFPPDDRHGLPSFRNVLTAVAEAWADRREELLAQGKHLVQQLDAYNRAKPSSRPISPEILQSAVHTLSEAYDPEYGGFGNAPKFPQAPVLEYVLRAAGAGIGQSKQMIDHTLERMARGGIYDQLAGGFARYSVDPLWLVPHFEKMLYDNAQLARVYTHAWQLLQRPLYKRIALETLDYLLDEMRDDAGGFHSSEDADSEGVEGKFYVWSYDEFMEIAPDAAGYYGVTRGGNFEGSNILTARDDDPPQEARSALLEHRAKRVRPGRDDKVLASWNALTISALAEAYGAFQEP